MTLGIVLAVAFAPLLIAYVVACFRDPVRYALLPYSVVIPFGSVYSVGKSSFGSVSSLLGLLLGVALLAQLATTRRGPERLHAALPLWLGFLALCGFSLFWSIAPGQTVSHFTVLVSQVLLYLALALTRLDRSALRLFEFGIALGGVLVVCYGMYQLGTGGFPPGPGGTPGRFGDNLLGANNQAASLLLPLAIVAARALTGPFLWRVAYSGATLLLLFGVVATGSRGGLLAAVVVVGAVLLFGSARKSTVLALGGLGAVLLVLVLVVQPAGVGQRQVNRTTSSSGRSDIWTVALRSCPEFCGQGAGWGAFPTLYQEKLESVVSARVLVQGVAYQPHNIYLLALLENGIAGLALVLAGLGLAIKSALRLPRAMRAPPVGALLGTVVSSFFLSNLEYKFFWVLLAYVAMAETAGSVDEVPGPSVPVAVSEPPVAVRPVGA